MCFCFIAKICGSCAKSRPGVLLRRDHRPWGKYLPLQTVVSRHSNRAMYVSTPVLEYIDAAVRALQQPHRAFAGVELWTIPDQIGNTGIMPTRCPLNVMLFAVARFILAFIERLSELKTRLQLPVEQSLVHEENLRLQWRYVFSNWVACRNT